MNTLQLKKWKEAENNRAGELAEKISKKENLDIIDFFPEFKLLPPYTTSLEPYVPIWALLPFFKTIIVGITPYLKTREDFKDWYGLWPEQILELAKQGRIIIRVGFPRATSSIPSYLNPFFESGFPSSIRDQYYDRLLLGEAGEKEAKLRFSRTMGQSIPSKSIDSFEGHKQRAYTTAENAYLQLLSLGYAKEAAHFEEIVATGDLSLAFNWLEACRLFLVGPVHYSFNGIHFVSGNAPLIGRQLIKTSGMPTQIYPNEIGKSLISRLGLVRPKGMVPESGLEGILDVYPDYDKARSALLSLDQAIKGEGDLAVLTNTERFQQEMSIFDKRADIWIQGIRYVGVVTGSAIGEILSGKTGFLAGLGFGIATEALRNKIDHGLLPVGRSLAELGRPRHLTIIYDLAKDVKDHFKD